MQKFENVDILKSLKAIMQTHTEHFQSDFDIDIKTLKQAAKSPNPEDKSSSGYAAPPGRGACGNVTLSSKAHGNITLSAFTPSRQATRYLPMPWS